jgi:short subunit dehydrogenase-like uncharacterized protein
MTQSTARQKVSRIGVAEPWMVYGAYGYTGRRIVRALLSRGHRPVLAGRDAGQLQALACEYGDLQTRVFDANSFPGPPGFPGKRGLLINAAGPFAYTAVALARSCIESGCHYMDVGNEPGVLQEIYKLNDEAAAAGVVLLPGAGFGVTLSSCLALRLKVAVPDANDLDILLAPSSAGRGPGTQKTFLQGVLQGAMGVRDGVWQQLPRYGTPRRRRLPFGQMTLIPAALGDAEAARLTTNINNITAHIGLRLPPALAVCILNGVRLALNAPGIRQKVRKRIMSPSRTGKVPPSAEARTGTFREHRSYVWAACRSRTGSERAMWVEAGEGYEVTVEAVVASADAIASGKVSRYGAHTAASAFGAGFLDRLPGVTVRSA